MIISFGVKNFLSFKDYQEITFRPSSDDGKIDSSLMVFGPNGSGKTNLVLALTYCLNRMGMYDKGMFYHLSSQEEKRLNGDLHNRTNKDPVVMFRFRFRVLDHVFIYEFSIDTLNDLIVTEKITDNQDTAYFEREGTKLLFCGKTLKLNIEDLEHKLLIDDTGQIPKELANFMDLIRVSLGGIVITTYDVGLREIYDKLLNNPHENVIITVSDLYMCSPGDLDRLSCSLGFIGIEKVKKDPSDVKISSEIRNHAFCVLPGELVYSDGRRFYNVRFKEGGFERYRSFSELSTGSQRVISLIVSLFEVVYTRNMMISKINPALINEGITTSPLLVVDEMCYSLHPKIAKELLKVIKELYSGDEVLQTIYTIHNTEVMSFADIRPDSVYLLNKVDSASEVYSLSDFDDIDNWDFDSIKTGYLEGRFGGIPKTLNYWRLLNDS